MNIFSYPYRETQDPPVARFLFASTSSAWLWPVACIYQGWEWLQAGLHKLTPAWLDTGEALQGFWTSAIMVPDQGRPPIAFGWYRNFIAYLPEIENYAWFAKVIFFGEILIGVALIASAFCFLWSGTHPENHYSRGGQHRRFARDIDNATHVGLTHSSGFDTEKHRPPSTPGARWIA